MQCFAQYGKMSKAMAWQNEEGEGNGSLKLENQSYINEEMINK